MQLGGRRVHIAGSASSNTSTELLLYAHALVESLVKALLFGGSRLVVGVGKEPHVDNTDPMSPSIIFDWTVLTAAGVLVADESIQPRSSQGPVIATVATERTQDQIPPPRRDLWQSLLDDGSVLLEYAPPGWTSGAVRRIRQSQLGDILIALSGGEGVEHLTQLYAHAGKPVIPLDLDLGASSDEGGGRAARLFRRAQAKPSVFARFTDPTVGGAQFANLSTHHGNRPVPEVVESLLRLIDSLAPPSAFYVRLLNQEVTEFEAVESFFRHVVDPVVRGFGYEPVQMGIGASEYAWMNEAIFDQLHHSQLAVVDLTGNRPNCFMELGYALGRELRVLVTAMADTKSQFDSQMIERHDWKQDGAIDIEQQRFRDYWARNIDRPALVRPRDIL